MFAERAVRVRFFGAFSTEPVASNFRTRRVIVLEAGDNAAPYRFTRNFPPFTPVNKLHTLLPPPPRAFDLLFQRSAHRGAKRGAQCDAAGSTPR